MSRATFLLSLALVLACAAPAQAVEPFIQLEDVLNSMAPAPQEAPQQQAPAPQAPVPQPPAPQKANGPVYMDQELAREHERFSQFAREQMRRMNATMLGGKNSMQVYKDGRGYRASYKAIDVDGIVCQVRRAESNPNYFVGVVIYKERIMENAAPTAEACRRGEFEPVSEKSSRIIYSSKLGGGWQ